MPNRIVGLQFLLIFVTNLFLNYFELIINLR